MASYKVAHLSQLRSPVGAEPGSYEWKPIRNHFGVRAFGVNAMVAHKAGDQVVEPHTEAQANAARHEELYYVATGCARFVVAGDAFDAPVGTLVFVSDPQALREAKAIEPDTTVLVVGAAPGVPFSVSAWERKYFDV